MEKNLLRKTEVEEYEKFVKNDELCDFTQSIKWSNIKEFWKSEFIIIRNNDGKIVLSVNVLIRKIPIFGNLMYVPRGPIGNIKDKENLEKMTNQFKILAKKYRAFIIIIEPNIENTNKEFLNELKKLGYKINNKAKKFTNQIQSRYNFRVNLEGKTQEEVFKNFSSKTRYNIKYATRKGVVIKEKNFEGLDEFYKLMQETGKRDKIIIRNKEYYKKVLKEFGEDVKIYIAYYEDTPIASIMPIIYGKKMWYLYGASGNKYRNYMPNYLLQWEMIKLAIQRKCKIYDLRGFEIDKKKENGLYRFKKGFGGDLVELIGQVYIIFNPIRYIGYKITKRIFVTCRHEIYSHSHWGRF